MLLTNKDIKELNIKFKKCIENTVNRQNNTPFSFVDVDGLIVGLREEWALTIYNNKVLLNNYLYSNYGRVKNVNSKQLIKQRLNIKNGYFKIKLNRDGKGYHIETHRLVAQCFSDNPYNKKYVNHINECKTFNIALNLNWMTQKENSNYGTNKERIRLSLSLSNKNKKHCKKVYQYNLEGDLVKIYDSVKSTKIDGFNSSSVSKGCRSFKLYSNYVWSYKKLNKEEVSKITQKEFKVYQYSLKGDLVKGYYKLLDVLEGGFNNNLISSIYKDGGIYNNFIWSNKELTKKDILIIIQKDKDKKEKLQNKCKEIYRYNLKDGSMKYYNSSREVERDGFERKSVRQCCNNDYGILKNIYKGYCWSYRELTNDEIEKLKTTNIDDTKKGKKVYQYTLDKKLVKIWNSSNECGKYGYTQQIVNKCCHNEYFSKKNVYKGFIWSFEPLEE